MDSKTEMIKTVHLDDIKPPGLNDLLLKLEFQCELYCIEEDTVKDMHLPLNKIHDTTQFNL